MNLTKLIFFGIIMAGFFAGLVLFGFKPKEKNLTIESFITSWDGKYKLTPQKEIKTTRI